MSDPKEITEHDRAFMAGLVEARAKLWIRRHRERGEIVRRELILDLAHASEALARWVSERFKGASVKRYSASFYRVRFVTKFVASLLVEIHPFLVGRLHEASLAFQFASTQGRPGRRLSEDQEVVRIQVDKDLAKLRRAGA